MKQVNEEAFLAAFREYSDALFRHAFFRVSSRERALDLTQDAFIKAWDYVRAGGEVRGFKSFLYRILNNLIIDEYRRKKTESLDAMSDEHQAMLEAETAEGSVWETEERIDEEVLIEKVKEGITELSPEYRSVVTLRFIDGFSPREIAEMSGETENAISVRLNRAIKKLRLILTPSI